MRCYSLDNIAHIPISKKDATHDIAKGRGQRAEGRRENIEGLRFQYLARVLIALATAIYLPNPP